MSPLAFQVHVLQIGHLALALSPLGGEQTQATDIAALPIKFNDPGSELPHPSRESWGRQAWRGGMETSFHLSFLEGTQESLGPGLSAFVSCCSRVTMGVEGLFILPALIPAWTPEHLIPVPLVPSGLAGARNRRDTYPESACFLSGCPSSPSWCLALIPTPAYDSSLQRDATCGSGRDYLSYEPRGTLPQTSPLASLSPSLPSAFCDLQVQSCAHADTQ